MEWCGMVWLHIRGNYRVLAQLVASGAVLNSKELIIIIT
jgi:hypothetical protein